MLIGMDALQALLIIMSFVSFCDGKIMEINEASCDRGKAALLEKIFEVRKLCAFCC